MSDFDKIVIATHNKHKLKEFKQILKDREILSLEDIGFYQEIEENGKTCEENASIKANTVQKFLHDKGLKYCVLADDSGLFVEALNGEPGVYSARYAGTGNDADNRKKVLEKLHSQDNRKAYMKAVIVLVQPNGAAIIVEGKTYGRILPYETENKSGFGYDPIFYSDELKKSFGEATDEEKNRVSHRGKAIAELMHKINAKENYYEEKAKFAYDMYRKGTPFLKVRAIVRKSDKFLFIGPKCESAENDIEKTIQKYNAIGKKVVIAPAGGGVDEEETLEQAVIREVEEELKVVCLPQKCIYEKEALHRCKYKDFEFDSLRKEYYYLCEYVKDCESKDFGIEGEFNGSVDVYELTKEQLPLCALPNEVVQILQNDVD